MLVEVVADKGRPVVIRFSDGTARELPDCMDITDALAKLTEFVTMVNVNIARSCCSLQMFLSK